MTEEQRERLTVLSQEMRKIAQSFGSLHPWWDVIIDMEELLKGRRTIVDMSPAEFIAYAESCFVKAGRRTPE